MNTKTFAQEARKILMQGVAKKLLFWGFNEKGETLEQPEKVSGGYSFRGEVFDDPSVPNLWQSLAIAIKNKGIDVVVEEAAYTWFNRIMALRILVKNGYEAPQLEDAQGLEHTPIILQKARQGKSDFLNAEEKNRLQKILTDYSKDQEAFAILIKGYCHSHKTLQRVFGKIDDYTELLLPDNMLQTDGFLHLLNTTDAISDDDYQKVELIGWLYQFYISEKKDDVFASFKKGKKAEAKDIPAATQIFTPNWIVKYMVENTAGKIWLDKHPNSALKTQMKYLVQNENDDNVSSSAVENSIISTIEDLTLIDPAAGSGHILVEGFDLIYKMYLEEYYTAEEAVKSILENNLFGLDIDDRAAQLATFAILLKAAKVYPTIWKKDWLPNVYAMPEAEDFSLQELKDFLGKDGAGFIEELDAALRLMKQAKNLGSVMKLELSEAARTYIEAQFATIKTAEFRDFNIEAIYQKLASYIPVLLLLTKKYTSVVANPPYMGQKNMNADLKNYVNANYPLSKSDLFAVFMESTLAMNVANGLMGMINQHSWMFLSSYQKLREHIFKNYGIVNMLHLGSRTFEELSGEVVQSTAFVFNRVTIPSDESLEYSGTYFRLVEHKNVNEKEENFLERNSQFSNVSQTNFSKIPGNSIGYWVSENMIKSFQKKVTGEQYRITAGIRTSADAQYLRYWHEVSKIKLDKNCKTEKDLIDNSNKWFAFNKGGTFRKWFGNLEHVIDFENNAYNLRNFSHDCRLRDPKIYFKENITWSRISGGSIGFRICEEGSLVGDASPIWMVENEKERYTIMGFLNCDVSKSILSFINPTLTYQVRDVSMIPYSYVEQKEVFDYVKENIKISRLDWNRYENSWDFERSPLFNNTKSLEESYLTWEKKVAKDFFQLHSNEEKINKIFIDIYELQDELTPEITLKDITILQEELKKNDVEKLEEAFREHGAEAIELPINKAEVISQFISYAIGLFMGRYRLDKKGLNIAHPNPTAAELESYSYNNGSIVIDEDAILPLMGTACNFPDDALQQIYNLLDVIWGTETRTENINFIQECLNKDLEKFLVKDFYKYHCKMYKKKPIYWLFASKKGAFQVLVYMHRMNAFTVEKIRANYLLEHIKNIDSEISLLESNEANLNTQEAKKLDQLRKNIQECYEYDTELKDMADKQITFDLDDGVTVNYKKFETVVAKIK
tara:strand:- start:6039 stop:9590 length:3552 start_codon:yes stop_codon:yes gene_type:complete